MCFLLSHENPDAGTITRSVFGVADNLTALWAGAGKEMLCAHFIGWMKFRFTGFRKEGCSSCLAHNRWCFGSRSMPAHISRDILIQTNRSPGCWKAGWTFKSETTLRGAAGQV